MTPIEAGFTMLAQPLPKRPRCCATIKGGYRNGGPCLFAASWALPDGRKVCRTHAKTIAKEAALEAAYAGL